VELFRLLQLLAQLLDPAPVGRLRLRIEDRPRVTEIGDSEPVGRDLPCPRAAVALHHELAYVEVLARVAQQVGDVVEPLRVPEAADGALPGERPVIALAAEDEARLGRRAPRLRRRCAG